MRRRKMIAFCALAAVAASSCTHKDLCFDHDPHALKYGVIVEAEYEREWFRLYDGGTDWSSYPGWSEEFGTDYDALRPGIPSGLRVRIYNQDNTHDMANIAPEGGLVHIGEGEHSLLFHNNDTEYILFKDMQSFSTAKATTRSNVRPSYSGSAMHRNEVTVNPPDMLYGNYMESYTSRKQAEPDLLPVTMHPLVFTYLVQYRFSSGLKYVSLARGALAGMAESVYLNSGRTSEEEVTILFDCTLYREGATASVLSFGVPDFPNEYYKTKSDKRYSLNLEVKLKNGKMKRFDFDITEQIKGQPQGGVIVVEGIVITDDEGMGGNSGFDVDVDGWGDYEDIELPL